ncbi:glycosyltransferase family 39 protein [Bacillus sp. AFS041924]|uniref:glycosyltransferase family 39 protein n=1 Tax=Bacillus sp. AFS041924 TaxID=2033503 RepID=UPI000BFE7FF8|nr:glycosyltransferase family 39 protein [Bacillus sp. AFS041924]PGS52579.1 hypothetical protein COC46_08960 [Bacillus sp. AFS041924]
MKDINIDESILVKRMIVTFSVLSIMFILWSQLTHLNSYAASYDQVDFALALDRFDLMAMQPHFPGYPYFILGGLIVHLFVNDQVSSLTLFNILFYFSACIPMYLLVRDYLSKTHGILLTAICYSSTYLVISVNQPMSEGAALAAFSWYFWSLVNSLKKNDLLSTILPLFLLSVLLGIRLSYLPFTVGLLILLYKKRKSRQFSSKKVIYSLLIAGIFQFIWVFALVISEGNLKGFIKLSLAFTSGHFNNWGNTVVADNQSIFERIKIVAFDNLLWTGLTAQTVVIAVIYILLFGLFIFRLKRFHFITDHTMQFAILMGGAYFIWALFAQNSDKPRHILPVILLLIFILFYNLLKESRNILTYLLCIILLIAQSYSSFKLLKRQISEVPATIQLANYLKKNEQSSIVYTWEETRVFDYENVQVPHKQIETYDFFLHDQSYYKNKKILLTNKVVEGFKEQGNDLSGKIKVIREFKSDPIFDPVYDEVVLYEWVNQ